MKHNIVMNVSDDHSVTEIDIFGTIGDDWWGGDSTSQRQVLDAIRSSKSKEIKININSGGGSVFEGMAMYDAIKSTKAKTTARILGFAGSMATIVMLAADRVEAVDGSLIMIHNPSTMVAGESKDLKKKADVLDKLKDSMVSIYQSKSGLDKEDIEAMMNDETWLSAKESQSLGFIDAIVGEETDAEASLQSLYLMDTSPSAKIPLRFAAKIGGVSSLPKMGNMEDENTGEEETLSILDDLIDILGLDEDASEEDVLTAVEELVEADGDEDAVEEDDGEALYDDDIVAELPNDSDKVLVARSTLESLVEDSENAKAASNEQVVSATVEKAVAEGRIPAFRSEAYKDALRADFDTFFGLLTNDESDGGLAVGLIPVKEIGTSHDANSRGVDGPPTEYDTSLFPQLKNRK